MLPCHRQEELLQGGGCPGGQGHILAPPSPSLLPAFSLAPRTSLVVPWLRTSHFQSSNAGDAGLIPGLGTDSLAMWHGQKKKKI